MWQPLSYCYRAIVASLLVVGLSSSLSAATLTKVNDDVIAPLRNVRAAKQIRLNNVPLYAHGTATVELDEFQLWAPGAKVIVHDGSNVKYQDPPPMRFFRGMVNGDPESFAFFSVDGTTGAINGLIATRDGKFAIDASRRSAALRKPNGIAGGSDDFDYFLTASDETDNLSMTGTTWSCDVEKLPVVPKMNQRFVKAEALGPNLQPIPHGITGTQAYAIAVEVETDYELFVNAGNDVNAVTALVTNLTGAVSTIYNRDLKTNVVLQNVNTYVTNTDPWSVTNANSGLYELGNYYHANHLSLKRSAVVMLSGKVTNSGVAWEGILGYGDFDAGSPNFGGAYAWCGSIGNLQGAFTSTAPNPNATVNGVLYGMPSGGNNYWPLEEYAHELGHTLAGHHTHCVVITAGEASGTNHPTQAFVDMCFTGEVEQASPFPACATGAQYSSAPTEKGTIMSYCHNVFSGAFPQSRFTFGQAAEVSHHELDDFMLNAAGPLQPYGGNDNIVTSVGTFTISAVGGPASVVANSTNNVASVTPSNGTTVTYAWTITGGTITSATNLASISYTAGPSGTVVLRATAYNTRANNGYGFPSGTTGVTDTKTVTITVPSINPPTNVVATALTSASVQLTWTAAASAVSYTIFRSTNNSTFTAVCGNPTPACPASSPFTDSSGLSASTAYMYKIKSVDGSGNLSASFSNADLATTVIFTDPVLTQQSTVTKGAHFSELRTAVTAVCALAGNPVPCSTAFTDPTLTLQVTPVKVLHLTELRNKLNAARSTLSLSAISYAEATGSIVAQSTTIKAAQVNELRGGVQ